MIKHIVMFKLKNEYTKEEKQKAAEQIKAALDELPNKISEIKAFEVGINLSNAETAYDLVLVSSFEDIESLNTYRVHPAHQAVVALINEHKKSSAVVDYLK